jgi:ferredoxin
MWVVEYSERMIVNESRPISLQVYYFSGTGNARRLAHWTVEAAKLRGLQARSDAIETLGPQLSTPLPETLVGFVYPVHGFTTIWAMLRFVLRFPRSTGGTKVFAMTSLGGCKVGKWILPGWEGNGLVLPLLILFLKGYRWAGALPVRSTPENWTSLIPGYGEMSSRWMLDKSHARLEKFVSRLFAGQWALYGLVTAALWLPLTPLTFLYLFWGRFFLAKTLFSSAGCNGCGTCASSCPVKAIEMKAGRPFWKFTCENCMRCVNYCPRAAVQAHLPFWILLWLFVLHPLARKAEEFAASCGPLSMPLLGVLMGGAVYVLATFLLVMAFYQVWDKLLKIDRVNRLFEFTAPTHYYHRYHEPDTAWKDYEQRDQASKSNV